MINSNLIVGGVISGNGSGLSNLQVESRISKVESQTNLWNTVYSWGNHTTNGYASAGEVSNYLSALSNSLAIAQSAMLTNQSALSTNYSTIAQADARYVNIIGDTMTGSLTINSNLVVGGTISGLGIRTTCAKTLCFEDNFNDNSINTFVWTFWGNSVAESDGIMQVLIQEPDDGGCLRSQAIPIRSHGLVTITRNVKLHHGYSDFFAHIALQFGDLPRVMICYGNANYNGAHGFYICRNNVSEWGADNGGADISQRISPIWDEWFKETISYDPQSGDLSYFINDVLQITYNVGIMPVSAAPLLTLFFDSAGWWTGHEHLFDNLIVSQDSGTLEVAGTVKAASFIGDGSGLMNLLADSRILEVSNALAAVDATLNSQLETLNFSFTNLLGTLNSSFTNLQSATSSNDARYVNVTGDIINGNLTIASNLVVGTGIANGLYSVAEGYNTTSSAYYAHAEGKSTRASGGASHAEGQSTMASGDCSHAEGISTTASGYYSHAEGASTTASGSRSHAAGWRAKATNSYTYVWSDGMDISSTMDQQYTVYAQNGIRLLGGSISGNGAGLTNLIVESRMSKVETQTNLWNTVYAWGNHATNGYAGAGAVSNQLSAVNLQFSVLSNGLSTAQSAISNLQSAMSICVTGTVVRVESDPIWAAVSNNYAIADAAAVTRLNGIEAKTNNWNTVFGWGSHATNGYVTGTVVCAESDPIWVAAQTNYLTATLSDLRFVNATGDVMTGSLTINSNLVVAGILSGNGSGLTALNASSFSSGTIPLAQLPSAVVTNGASGVSLTGVALLNSGNTFSGNQIINSGNVGIGTASPTEKLDVAGTVKASGGVKFSDGTTQTTAANEVWVRATVSNALQHVEAMGDLEMGVFAQ